MHKAGTAAGAGVEICGYLNLNVRIVFVVSRAEQQHQPTRLHRENLVRPEHLIEFRSTVIFLSPRIKYVSIHRESERDLICKTQVTFNLFEFTILRCPCRLRWRMDVTNISPQITILRRGRTCATSKSSNEGYSKVREDFTITEKANTRC